MATIRGKAIGDVTNLLEDIDGTEKIPVSSGNTEPQVVLTGELKEYINDGMQQALTFDAAPTSGSSNPVTSGGVHANTVSNVEIDNTQLLVTKGGTTTSQNINAVTARQATNDIYGRSFVTYYAPKDSPTLTGTPTAPTASGGDDSTQIATTAFVQGEISGKQDTISDLDTIRSGAAAGATAYQKPSTGIPKSDLASNVQASLNKADTALQSYTETDPVFEASAAAGITSSDITNWNSKTDNVGTITGITMNGASKGTSGVVDLGTVITEHQDISGKQDTLVSGTNIKTVNNQSLLGSSNITIDYDDLTNKPTIPTVNDATLTVQKEGTNIGTFTANASSASTINIVETDPVFTASAAYGITSSDITSWNNSPVLGDDDGTASNPEFDAYTDTVWHTEQTLSAAQKLQARTNIGAADASAVVTSFNGSTGAVTYTAPVTSVNGSTGAVTVQETLVSGTNIKTVNNTSLLGSGNISIEAGGGEENVIEAITFNGTSATIDSSTKTAAISYTPPVTSVNGSTGAVTVSVPTKISDLTDDSNFVESTAITTIVSISQSDYDALSTKDSATLYVITS